MSASWGEMTASRSPVQPFVLEHPDAIAVMFDSRQREALLPFLGRDIAVSQAAAEIQELPNTMLYRVRRWKRLGLLRESARVPHRKGFMQLYRSSADAYFIPFRATNAEDLRAFASGVYIPAFEAFLQAYVLQGQTLTGDWGVRFARQDQHWQVIPTRSADYECEPTDDDSPAALLDLYRLQLGETRAKDLQRELRRLLERYAAQQTPQGRTYQVIVGLA